MVGTYLWALQNLPKLPHLIQNLALRREASLVALREHLIPVDGDDENASAAADDLAVDPELSFDLSRQTGGSWEVVSNAAVVDSNVHESQWISRLVD